MKPDKKQVPQLIVLGLLVLGCVGYVSFQVMTPSAAPDPKQAEAKSEQTKVVVTTASVASAVPDNTAYRVFPGLSTVPSRRDPFIPQALPGAIDLNAPTPGVKQVRPVNTQPMPFGKLPKIDIKPLNPFGGSGASTGLPHPPAAVEQEPKFTLTGVVRGTENVAIIYGGDGGRYVVRQGQMIEGRFKVLMVLSDAVVLSDKGRRIYVRLGGEQNAS